MRIGAHVARVGIGRSFFPSGGRWAGLRTPDPPIRAQNPRENDVTGVPGDGFGARGLTVGGVVSTISASIQRFHYSEEKAMEQVRFGVIGLGNMGSFHLGTFKDIENAKLTAICDLDAGKREKFAKQYGVPAFATSDELMDSGLVDAVLIATPHYDHEPITIAAFNKGLHVLCEKPATVTVRGARAMNEAHKKHPNLVFGIMFNQRTSAMYGKLREVIADGELGEISRVTWLITDWFRTWTYYASGGWRATWLGEGGGVLINQCPHNLDLIQWITGMMPSRVTAVASIGKTHPIEVEDEVSAIFEYPNGAIGHFVTSTGEAPGTNRLEICGDRGKIVAEKGKLHFWRTRKSVQEVNRTSQESFTSVETWELDIPFRSKQEGHAVITKNFANAILKGEPLIAPGEEGVKGLEIGNAMLMAGITRQPVDLPMDGEAYEAFIKDLAKKYGGKKTLKASAAKVDMTASFK
jgi:predicted dehydrogenase